MKIHVAIQIKYTKLKLQDTKNVIYFTSSTCPLK